MKLGNKGESRLIVFAMYFEVGLSSIGGVSVSANLKEVQRRYKGGTNKLSAICVYMAALDT